MNAPLEKWCILAIIWTFLIEDGVKVFVIITTSHRSPGYKTIMQSIAFKPMPSHRPVATDILCRQILWNILGVGKFYVGLSSYQSFEINLSAKLSLDPPTTSSFAANLPSQTENEQKAKKRTSYSKSSYWLSFIDKLALTEFIDETLAKNISSPKDV